MLELKDQRRFWSKVIISNSDICWEWIAGKCVDHYGNFWLNNKTEGAHRIAYEEVFGKPPIGMLVCHKCDNPSCCNPYHLFIGTYQDNSDDRKNKGRCGPCGMKKGTKLSEKTKRAISKALIGNQYRKGIPHTDEIKKQIGDNFRGKTWKVIDGKRVWVR